MSYDDFTRGLPPEVRDMADEMTFDAFGPVIPDGPPKKTSAKTRFAEIKRKLVRLDEVKPVLEVNYLVKGWLTANGLSMVYGPSNAGKTFVVLDLAMHVAAGEPWRGCKVNPGPVLYIAAEGGSGVLNRLAAFKLEYPAMADAPFYLLPIGVDLHGPGDAELITALLNDKPPVLIVIDTLARSIGDGDENTAKDAAMFVRNCDLIREATGAHILIIHHSGKDAAKGARGSSALRAAVDSEIAVHGCDGRGRITSEKQRDMIAPADLWFALRSVTLGTDEDGDPVTSAVVDPTDKPVSLRKPLKGKDQVAMTALNEALDKHGRAGTGEDYPRCRIVEVEQWREACDAHGLTTGSSDSAARQAFKRAKDKLMDLDEVREFGGYVWRVRDDA